MKTATKTPKYRRSQYDGGWTGPLFRVVVYLDNYINWTRLFP